MGLSGSLQQDVPELQDKLNTERHELSTILISNKLKLNYKQHEMAHIIRTDLDTYLKMENASEDITISDYIKSLHYIHKYVNEQIA